LFVDLGVRSQKMERLLNQYCYSKAEDGSGSFQPFCTTQAPTGTNANGTVTFAGNTGTWIKPYKTKVDFQKVLPKVGLTYTVATNAQVFANYSEAMSSPKTDDYYAVTLNAAKAITIANPLPELTKTSEFGYRYNSSKVTASAVVWATRFDNRIVSTYDPTTDTYQDRNIGSVDLTGVEGAYAFRPIAAMSLYANLSYTKSKVLSDEFLGLDGAGKSYYLPIKGKQVVDTPDWMSNVGMAYKATPDLSFTLSGKYVGERFATDTNEVKLKSYFTADTSIRYSLNSILPYLKGAYLQLNGSNILGERYLTTGSGTTATTVSTYTDPLGKSLAAQPSYYRGAPTTYMLTLQTQF
ncbi:MAG: TonB-dependent receptor domain-containing protein, partial [Asticcacaulis sp.]